METFSRKSDNGLSGAESRLLGKLIEAIRDIRCGSMLLVIHDNRLVEIQRTTKVRSAGSHDDNEKSAWPTRSGRAPRRASIC